MKSYEQDCLRHCKNEKDIDIFIEPCPIGIEAVN